MFSIRKWRMAPFLSTTSFAHPIYHLSTACEFLNRASPIAQTAHAPGVEILFSIAFFVFLGPRLPSVRGPSMVKGDCEGKLSFDFSRQRRTNAPRSCLPLSLIVSALFASCPHFIMAKHHPDLVMCRKQPGVAIGRLCEKCKLQHTIWFMKAV